MDKQMSGLRYGPEKDIRPAAAGAAADEAGDAESLPLRQAVSVSAVTAISDPTATPRPRRRVLAASGILLSPPRVVVRTHVGMGCAQWVRCASTVIHDAADRLMTH
ncbi:hypothetical protein AB0C96_42470 [Streptomyces sp. NPDC048506]|uniref:hypothetical protein n=1 Tax=Streptomyces sp. NPDC048506 TaxID=3155028 RepID=UPI00343DF3AF